MFSSLIRDLLTIISASVWAHELSSHPDSAYVDYILQGISKGFRIGFDRRQSIHSASGGLHLDKPEVVSRVSPERGATGEDVEASVSSTTKRDTHQPPRCHPKNKPGKWRLIVDLSSPQGASVNDGIDADRSSLSYASLDHLAALVVAAGRGSFLVKADC